MSTLLVEPLEGTPLTQEFTLKSQRLNLTAIRPRLYLHNDPTGTFTLNLKYNGNIISSADFTVADIKSGASYNDNEYHHGFIKLDMGAVLNLGFTYQLELTSSGYTFAESSYLGWIKEFENQTNTFSTSVTTIDEYPFGYQLWGY